MKTFVLILVNVYMVHGYGECFPEMVNKTYLHLPPQNGPPVVNTPSNEECFLHCVENVKCIAYTFMYDSLECSLFHFMPDIELPENEIACQSHCLTRYLSLPHCMDISNDTPFYHSYLTSFGVLCKNQLKMQMEFNSSKEFIEINHKIEIEKLKKEMENMNSTHQIQLRKEMDDKITSLEKTMQNQLKENMEKVSSMEKIIQIQLRKEMDDKITSLEKTMQIQLKKNMDKVLNMEKNIQIQLRKEMDDKITRLEKTMQIQLKKNIDNVSSMEKIIQSLSNCLSTGMTIDTIKTCKDGWTRSTATGYCYKVFTEAFPDWFHAKARCESEGAELATIHSSQEMNFVKDLLAKSSVQTHAWLGGTDAVNEGSWKWSNGCSVNYFNWYPGEPNNLHNEDCMVVRIFNGWTMADYSCRYGGVNAVCKTTA